MNTNAQFNTQPQIANLLHCCYIEQLLPEDYDGSGNITRNTKVSPYYYSYNASQPNAVSGIESNPGMVSSAQCDGTSASGTRGEALCVVAPSLFREKIESISQDGWTLQLAYGDGLQRESEVLTHNSTAVCTTNFVSDDCEHEIRPGGSRYLDYIRADGRIVAIHVKNGTTDSIYYVQTDLLGSWERIVDNNRNVVQSSHFDPWGNRMSATDWTAGQDGTSFSFRRGFTGHEHYDRFRIINMNARLYDPVIGRFFSPDPQVQNPFSTQGLNRYSYCGNNPVMHIDEDGEFGLLAAILLSATVVGSINLGIHISQGDVSNFWQGVGYFAQGAVAGIFIGTTWWGGWTLLSASSTPLWIKVAIVTAKSIDIATTYSSTMENPSNAFKIIGGRYYFDENMGHGILQAITRFSTELPQTWLGYNYSHMRNALGLVDRVDYLGGATFATNEYNGSIKNESWGVSIGSFINMSISGEIDKDFRDYVLGRQLYMHEYGHTIQSQMLGISYLLAIGIPSLISANSSHKIQGDAYGADTHDYFFSETWANRLASRYFGRFYGYSWNEYGYPLYNWR